MPTDISISQYIDHTLLKADAQIEQITKLCKEAMEFHFFSVCVNSHYVPLCKSLLKTSNIKICSVVGFPLGMMSSKAKAFETNLAVQNGADEIDMVINIGALKDHQYDLVREDIAEVVNAAQGRIVKVIIETALLSEAQKIKACELSVAAKADFVKTCTGFGGGGATIEDIRLMKKVVDGKALVKASGGIKDREQALTMIEAGASRLGTSSGIVIVQGQTATGGY